MKEVLKNLSVQVVEETGGILVDALKTVRFALQGKNLVAITCSVFLVWGALFVSGIVPAPVLK